LLELDDLRDGLVLQRYEVVRLSFARGNVVSLLHQFLGTEQGANMLRTEGRTSLEGRHIRFNSTGSAETKTMRM
jgi:hypothetical protein